jgi:hypothetical protein
MGQRTVTPPMSNPETNGTEAKHSPYRLLVIGAILTTVGSITAGVVLSWVDNDSEPTTSDLSADRSSNGSSAVPASATPMLDPAHRDSFVGEIGGDLKIDGAVDINGERFTYGAAWRCSIGCGTTYDDFVEFNLGRDYRKFRATLGLADDSPQGVKRRFRVLADGRLLYERDFALGQSEAVTLDVTGALRLRVEVLDSHFSFGAIGDPTVE